LEKIQSRSDLGPEWHSSPPHLLIHQKNGINGVMALTLLHKGMSPDALVLVNGKKEDTSFLLSIM